MPKFKVGDKIKVVNRDLENTRKRHGLDPHMLDIIHKKFVTVKKVNNNGVVQLKEDSFPWNEDDFELYESGNPIPEVGDIIEVLKVTNLNGTVPTGATLVLRDNYADSYHFEVRFWPEKLKWEGSSWNISKNIFDKALEENRIRIINKSQVIQPVTIEKETNKMTIPTNNQDKIRYSKLTKDQKEYYKAGLMNLDGSLTLGGSEFVKAYIEDKFKDEALKSILTTLKSVDEEINA